MCNNCFSKVYYQFESQQENDAFELLLSQTLATGNLTVLEDSTHPYFNTSIYKCNSCNTQWWYSFPENAWRGFFLPQESAILHLEEIKRRDKKVAIRGCIVILIAIAILACIIFLAIRNNT